MKIDKTEDRLMWESIGLDADREQRALINETLERLLSRIEREESTIPTSLECIILF